MTLTAFSKEDFFTLYNICLRRHGATMHPIIMAFVFSGGWFEVEKDSTSAAEFFNKEVKRHVPI
jgi:hypothetical protein